MKPKVSTLGVTYNHAKYLRQMLDSVFMQKTDFDFEVIIHDDASTDGTIDILQEYQKQYPDKLKLILEKTNQYVKHTFEFVNDLYQAAEGEYITVCEGDDYWTDPHKLQRQVDFLDSHKDYNVCFHPVRVITEPSGEESVYPEEKADFTLERLIEHNFIQTCSVMYRRRDKYDYPAGAMPQDWYYHLLHAQAGKIGFIDEVMAVYRRHGGSVWEDSDKEQSRIWLRFGRGHLTLYRWMMETFGAKDEYKAIIVSHIINALNAIKRADKKLFDDVLTEYPDCAEVYYDNLAEQIDKLNQHAKEQAKIIEHWQNEAAAAKREAEALKHRLHREPSYKLKRIIRRNK